MPDLGQEAYDGLAAWQRADGSGDLRKFVDVLMSPVDEVAGIVRDSDDYVGWGRLLDVDAAPEEALPWLAQFVGVTPLRGLDSESQRLRIKSAAGFKRGSVEGIKAAAAQFLVGGRQVDVFERDGGSAWRFRVRTYRAETPNPVAVKEAIAALKPAGVVFVHEVQQGLSINDVPATIGEYTQSIESFSDTTSDSVIPVTDQGFGSGSFGSGPFGGL